MNMNYKELLAVIPKDLYIKSPAKAWCSLILNFTMFFVTCSIVLKIDHYLIGSIIGTVILGLLLTGFFVIGHDAGHRSFSDSEKVNDIVGHLTTSFLGWPFHLWRLAHNVHHLHTNHVRKDIAWEPHTNEQISRLPGVFKVTYVTVRSKLWAFWTGACFHNLELWIKFFKGKLYKPEDRRKVSLSIGLSIVATIAYALAAFLLGGWYGLLTLFVLPQLAFYFWMTTFTLLHHTHPDLEFKSESQWRKVEAQLDGTINVRYGRFVDFFTHDIAWHIPHHISVAIPFYHLKKAHLHIAAAFPHRVKDCFFSLTHLRAVLKTCQAIESFQQPHWMPFEDWPGLVELRSKNKGVADMMQ